MPGRLLVVDDEPALLQLMRRYLSKLGYDVETCADGASACGTYGSGTDGFSLVLLDMSLPDMRGEDVLGRLIEINPAVRVLICSGYPFEVARLAAQEPFQFGFLQKPFLPKMLAEAVDN